MTKVSKAPVKQEASQKSEASAKPGELGKQDHRSLPRNRPIKVCWTCHFRKVKCDFQRPTCSSCKELGCDCTWDNRYYDRLRRGPKGRKKKTSRQVTPELKEDSEDSHSDKCAADAVCTPLSPNEQGASTSPRSTLVGTAEGDSPITVVRHGSSDSDDRSNMEIIQRVTPDRDRFCSLNSFMAVVERLQRIDYNNCPAPLSIEEISRLHVLWDEYVYRRPMAGQLVVANTTNRSLNERMAFYNTACAIIGLAQGAMYLRNGSCQSVMQLAGEVAWALAEEMVDMLATYNDEITDEIIKAVFYMIKMAVYGSVLASVNRSGLMKKFVPLLERQNEGKPAHDIQHNMHMILLMGTMLDQTSPPDSLSRNLVDLIARRRIEMKEFPAVCGWTWGRYLAFVGSSVLSASIVIVLFLHKTVGRGRAMIPFNELTPALQEMVHSQILELQEIRAMQEVSGATHPPGVALLSHTIGMLGYLLHYAGLISDMEALEMMTPPLNFVLQDFALDHPFNHCVFIPLYLIMSGVFRIDPATCFRLVKPCMLPLQDPRLTAHGAALNHYLHLIESSHDGGVEATRNLAGLDGVRLFSTPMVKNRERGALGSDVN